MRLLAALLAVLLAGCVPEYPFPVSWLAPPDSCSTEKIQFTQEDGCLNDGSFEFCIVNNNDALLSKLYETVPNMTCIRAGGRARCDLQTQMLCLVSTEGLCHAGQPQPRALTDEGWALACNLASQPYIEKIVATWYE